MPRPSQRRAGVSARRWSAGRWAIWRKGSGSRPVAGNGETNGAARKQDGPKRVGVLALQGDFREHAEILRKLGVEPVEVREGGDLEGLAGIIVPGGESTAIGK